MKTPSKALLGFVLCLLSGILFWISWPPNHGTILIFTALVPILIVERFVEKGHLSPRLFFLFAYLSFFIWNVSTTHWIYHATMTGALLVHLINPILFLIPFICLRAVKNRLGPTLAYVTLILVWISVELLHHRWEFAFPFLTLGNSLAMHPEFVQFYEYTGVLGGSLWVLIINILAFLLVKNLFFEFDSTRTRFKAALAICLLSIVIVPGWLSLRTFNSYEATGEKVNIVIAHPAIDCKKEKYAMSVQDAISKHISLSFHEIDSTTDYVLWPETAITNGGWLEDVATNESIQTIMQRLHRFPRVNLISGAIFYEAWRDSEREEPGDLNNVRYHEEWKIWYQTYNAAIQLSSGPSNFFFRSKVKLVPVEETIPYGRNFSFLREIVNSLGGYSFSIRSANNNVFMSSKKAGALICYESLFGDFVSGFAKNGAEILFILLNEGWYQHRTGAAQFLHYASLRAIENRRCIARASNYGVSSFTDQRGKILLREDGNRPKSLKATLETNNRKTFYTHYGDVIGIITVISSLVIMSITGMRYWWAKRA